MPETSATFAEAASATLLPASSPPLYSASLIDDHRPAQEILTIACLDSSCHIFIVLEFCEPKAACFAGHLSARDLDGISLELGMAEPVFSRLD